MASAAPYWGNLPASTPTKTAASPRDPRPAPVGASSGLTASDRQLSLDAAAQLQPKPNRVSVQTTNTEAPTESTMSPFASPVSPQFPDQGLAPRPPSFPYSAPTRRRHSRSHSNQSSDREPPETPDDDADPLPAAPEVPRGPPLSYRLPYTSTGYAYPPGPPNSQQSTPRTVRRHEITSLADPMDVDSAGDYYMTPAITPAQAAARTQGGDSRSRMPVDPSSPTRPRQRSISGSARPQIETPQQRRPAPSAASAPSSAEAHTPRRRGAGGGSSGSGDRQRKFESIRSPLQQLELTLDSITKEEKRARVAAAEQAVIERDRRASAARSAGASSQQAQPARSQPRSQPIQVRFQEADGEPRPLLQPEMSPVQESYQEAVARQLPLSEYPDRPPPPPPDSEKPRNRRPAPSASAGPQRNLSFRERAARNDVRLPLADEVLASAPAAAGAIPQRQSSARSAKLRKEPPGDPWFSRRTDAEKLSQNVQTRNALPTAVAVEPGVGVDPGTPLTPQAVATSRQQQFPQSQNAGKLVKSPSQRAKGQPISNLGSGGNRSHSLAEATAIGEAYAAAALADMAGNTAPSQRTARFAGDIDDGDDGDDGDEDDDVARARGAREKRHFDGPHHHRIAKLVYKARQRFQPGKGLYDPPEYLDEWKQGTVGALSGATLDLSNKTSPSSEVEKAWWEKSGRRRGSSTSARPRRAEAFEGEYDETNGPTRFKPPLHLFCGPLLRYCGIRKERPAAQRARNGEGPDSQPEREYWRGSVMIVTRDADSSYDIAPTLRLFAQPLELLPPPPLEVEGRTPPEYIDPLVGHPKLGRNGETLYTRPLEYLQQAKDLSRDETDKGLFEKTKTAADDAEGDAPGSFTARLKKTEIDGEKAGKFKDVRGFRLHAERGVTFWRFNIEVELRDEQQRIAYRINRGPSTGFWVPARDESMHIMFYSCNGFSLNVDSDQFSGPDPLWRDVLNTHQTQPFHVMIGGGDQLYNDAVMNQAKLFQEWTTQRNPIHKCNQPFTSGMQDELEEFYLNRYAMWFSQGLFSLANSQIPMVNMFDDHDIIDGFGSYPDYFMSSPVFSGLGNVAFKYYMLFQHQSIVDETEEAEPSWILGQTPGPYIGEVSRSVFMHLGAKVALLAIDCRTERSRTEVLTEETFSIIIDRCYRELRRGKTEHLLVQLGIPVAYPRLVWLENILTSRLMEPVKLLGKAGLLGNFLNKFDGGVEILDDLDDHWTSKGHKDERRAIIECLQDLAADKSVRITILSGDVHLAGVGQFFANPKQKKPKHRDFRYMPNVISSAIANTPPPDLLADVLNKRNKVHHFDRHTDENMIPLFTHDVDGKPRNNKALLPRRNWCSIQPYRPGATPAPTPNQSAFRLPPAETSVNGSRGTFSRASSFRQYVYNSNGSYDPSRPPLSGGGIFRRLSRSRRSVDAGPPPDMSDARPRRSFSLSRDLRPANLFRRLSSRRQKQPDDGGINGSWGADSEEGLPHEQYQQDSVATPPVPPKVPVSSANGGQAHNRGHGYDQGSSSRGGASNWQYGDGDDGNSTLSSEEDMPGGLGTGRQNGQQAVRIRGGAGSPSGPDGRSFEEFENGDENYFSVKRRPVAVARNNTAPNVAAAAAAAAATADATDDDGADPRPRGLFRTPTGLTAKQLKHAQDFEVDLNGALDIRINVEVDPKDPTGITVPYRLMVPRLWWFSKEDDASSTGRARRLARAGLARVKSLGRRKQAPAEPNRPQTPVPQLDDDEE